MPPKPKVTKDEIAAVALKIIKENIKFKKTKATRKNI